MAKRLAWKYENNEERMAAFMDKVLIGPNPDDCWFWLGTTNEDGYGMVGTGDDRKMLAAHRFIYEYLHGPIPKGMYVCHRCDEPSCVNPAHLWLGSSSDNRIDSVLKGRGADLRGEKNGSHRLTEKQVLEIRHLYEQGNASQRWLARLYGVAVATIGRVVRREKWTHI